MIRRLINRLRGRKQQHRFEMPITITHESDCISPELRAQIREQSEVAMELEAQGRLTIRNFEEEMLERERRRKKSMAFWPKLGKLS